MVKLKWAPKAIDDLHNICDYIALDSDEYARLVAKRIFELVETIPSFPYSDRIVPEYKNEAIREKIYMSYRIVYRISEGLIEIIRVFHHAQIIELQ